jgi:maltose alpha-D-glucosyltransferase/alpha-amylase
MPGTPLIIYGDEIGMGEDLTLKEWVSVRMPMQCSGERNGGFSRAPADKLTTQLIADGPFGYPTANVVAQRREGDSLLNWVQRAVHLRRQCAEFGWGEFHPLDTGADVVLAHRCDWDGGTVLAVHDISDTPCTVAIERGDDLPGPVFEIFTSGDDTTDEMNLQALQLEPYGYRWYRCCGGGIRR